MRLTLTNVTPMILPSLLTSPHTTTTLFPLPAIAHRVTRWRGSGVVVVGKVHKCGTKLMHNFLLERVAKGTPNAQLFEERAKLLFALST